MVEATIGVRDAFRRICADPKRTGLMMRCTETGRDCAGPPSGFYRNRFSNTALARSHASISVA